MHTRRRRRGRREPPWPTPPWSACRTASATRRSSPSWSPGDPRQHRHRRRGHRPGRGALRRPGRLVVRTVRAEPGLGGRGRPSWPACSPRAACAPTRSRTRAARSGRRSSSTRRPARSPRSPGSPSGQVCTDPALRAQVDRLIDEALAVCERAGIRLTRHPRDVGRRGDRRGVRAQAEHAAGRPGAAARPRSTSSTAASPPRAAASACRRRCTTAWSPWCTASNGPGRLAGHAVTTFETGRRRTHRTWTIGGSGRNVAERNQLSRCESPPIPAFPRV